MLKINKIKKLCHELSNDDTQLALRLIEDRNFDDLQYLVKSVVINIDINNQKIEPNQDILKLNEGAILELYMLITEYKEQLNDKDDD